MHLISSPGRLARALAAPVAVAAVLRNEAFLLPHFLAHYRALGVEAFLVVDNGSTDGTAERLAAEPDVALLAAETPFRAAAQGTDWKLALMALRPGRWTLVADADELLVLPEGERALAPLLARPPFAGADAVRLAMLDMYPKGPLAEATFAGGDPFTEAGWADSDPLRAASLFRGIFGDGRTRTSALRHRLFPGSRPELFVAEKVALLRYHPLMRVSVSLHYATGVRLAPRDLLLAHFKYHAEFHAKAEREAGRGQYFNGSEEYRKYLALPEGARGRLFDPAVSVPWQESRTARALRTPLR